MPPGAGHEDWLSLLEHVVAPIARAYRPDLLLVSAGFDAHRDDPLANCELTEDSYAALSAGMRALADELSAPLGFVLEGGYDLRALAASVAATMEAARDGAALPGVAGGRAGASARGRTTRSGGRLAATCSELRFRGCTGCGQKKGAVQARRPCPPLAKAPQRLALPPGSLVCNDRRKGDRRGAGLMVWREAMALRAFGSEAVESASDPCRPTLP